MTAGRSSIWIGRVVTALVSLVFLASAVGKLRGGPVVSQEMTRLGLAESMILPLSILELSCVAVYLVPATSVLGAILLTGFIGGTICTHWRVGDPFFIQTALGVFIWLGIYLREDRLKSLVPWRRP